MDAKKPQEKPDTPEAEDQPEPEDKVSADDRKPEKAEKLVFDEDFDSGGDPYNSTGSHVILELEKVSGGD